MGNMACATCHLVVRKWYDILPKPSDDESDMLELASANTNLSPCQMLPKSWTV